MLNIFNHFKEEFFTVLQEISKKYNIELTQEDFRRFTVEPTKDKSHGDLACNIAMVLSRNFSQVEGLNNPRKLAQNILDNLNNKDIEKLEIAGPGFINISLKNQIFHQIVTDLLKAGDFKYPNLGNEEKINLEYASPNPTGPIHVGHTRGAIFGDVLATLLQKVGYDVLKEYYINDAGSQINTLIKSAYLRYLEALGEKIEIPEGFYPGEYLILVGQEIKEKFQDDFKDLFIKENGILSLSPKYEENSQQYKDFRNFVVNSMVEMIKTDLLELGIKHDSYFSERENLHERDSTGKNKIEEAIQALKNTQKDGQALIYEGFLEAPKTEKGAGAVPEGYTDYKQTLFRSTAFGDDQDRVVEKVDRNAQSSDEENQNSKKVPTYLAGDMAYVQSKFDRGAKTMIMPLGADHAGYVKRLNAVVEALTGGQAKLRIILCQMVKFIKNGEPLKMSKRSGNFITAREVIDEVGADALRFIMLTRKNDAPFDFDLAKVIEQSKDNPIFYVQYAHARCCSVIRNLESEAIDLNIDLKNIEASDLKNLNDESEIELIKKIASFPRIVELAAVNFEPHRIAFYLQELAAQFHSLWNKGNDNPGLKFIIKDNLEVTKARIYLIMSLKIIISSGLDIFNIKAVEEMH